MSKLKLATMAAAVAAGAVGAAAAQSWSDERYDALSERIDAAARLGEITGADAASLREELGDVGTLAARYEMDGVSGPESAELNRRFDRLSTRIETVAAAEATAVGWYGGVGWNDRYGRWTPVSARKAELDRRIDRGLADGSLTGPEAMRLRTEFNQISRVEARYRLGGLSSWERADLDRRFDNLADDIRIERRDTQYGYGYGMDY